MASLRARTDTGRRRIGAESPTRPAPFKTHYNDQQTSTRGLHREAQETVT